jgi:cephalosporin hydroxylase
MITQRFNTDLKWRNGWPPNHYMYGFFQLLEFLECNIGHVFDHNQQLFGAPQSNNKMIEIGSYMGESTLMFASTGIFKNIHCIDPLKGTEKMNEDYGYEWDTVKQEFEINLRYFDNITLHEDYSYNVVDEFEDNSFDFIYIDASHTYEDTKKDIELYLPKVKKGGIIGGHDYQQDEFPGVKKSVLELVGKPDDVFRDYSWVKKL